jgi:hypothetical protein
MRRLVITTLVSLVGIVPAVAQVVQRPAVAQDQIGPKPDEQENGGEIAQSVAATLLNRLASAGFTDIEMTPISFAVRAKDADGNPVFLVLYPDSNSEWQVTPLDSDDDSTSSHHEEHH